MKTIFRSIFVLLSLVVLGACSGKADPYPGNSDRLIGRWKSNKELSEKYNSTHARLTDLQTDFLSQLLGRMEIEYREDGTSEIFMPAYEVDILGKQTSIEESLDSKVFTILGTDNNSVVFEAEDEYLGKQISVINFENDDTYWIYISNGVSDLHAREYFTRIKESGQEQEAAQSLP